MAALLETISREDVNLSDIFKDVNYFVYHCNFLYEASSGYDIYHRKEQTNKLVLRVMPNPPKDWNTQLIEKKVLRQVNFFVVGISQYPICCVVANLSQHAMHRQADRLDAGG